MLITFVTLDADYCDLQHLGSLCLFRKFTLLSQKNWNKVTSKVSSLRKVCIIILSQMCACASVFMWHNVPEALEFV